MSQLLSRNAGLLALGLLLCAGAAGCEHHGVVKYGDDRAVAVEFYAHAVDDARQPAVEHCAEYGRVPHFVGSSNNIAYFDCVSP